MNRQEKTNPIRILLVDDSPYFIEAARDFLRLQPAFDVVGTASDKEAALAQARRLNPDVILLDLNLAQSSGLALIPAFKQEVARARVIVLTIMDDPSYRAAALKAGADDFVSKHNMSKELVRVIFAVAGCAANAPAGEQPPSQSAPQQEISLERLAEHLPDLLYRYELTPKRGFSYVSPSATAMTGYSPAEYYADPDLGFKIVHPDDRPLLEKVAQGNFSPQTPVELRWVRKDGSILWTEQRNVPIYDAEGNLIAIEGIARDITERVRAEEQRAESEKRYRLISSVAADYMFSSSVKDGTLVLNWVAGAFETITGYTMEEYIARGGWRAHLHPDDIAQDDRDTENLRAGRRVVTEVRTMTKGGEIRWVRVYAHPVLDEHDKNLIGIYGAVQDITERKRAEEALRESEERYRDLVENIHDLICIHDLEGNLLSVNRAATELLGYSKEEIVGRNLRDFLAPQVRHLFDAYLSRLQRRGAASGLMNVLTKSGEVRVWEYDNTLRTEGVEKPIVRGYARDITEQKQAEEQLREAERFARSTLDSLSAHIAILGADGVILAVNRAWQRFAEMNGPLSGNVCEGANYLAVCDAAQGEDQFIAREFAAGIRRVLRGDAQEFAMEYPCHSPTEQRWFIGRVTRFVGEGPVRVVIAHENITERKQAEEALRESEARNRIIAEMISDYAYIFRITPEGRLIGEWVTESFTNVFGYTLEEVVARGGWQSLVYPDDLPIALAHAQKVARGEEDVCEMRWVTARGEIRWLRDYAKPVFDKTGKRVVRIYGASQDITERKQAEKALKEAKANLQALLDNREDYIWSLDRDYNYIVFNKPYADVIYSNLGVRLEKGMNALEIHPKEVVDFWKPKFDEVFEGQYVTFEFSQVLDGKEHFFEVFMNPINTEGEITGLSALSMDITERKQAEKELTKLSTAVAQSPAIIAMTDAEGNLEYVNPKFTEITGYRREEVIGKNPRILKSGQYPPEMYKELWETISSGKIWRGELLNKKKNGELHWELASISPVVDEQGNIINYIKVAEDITEHKRAEAQIRRQLAELTALHAVAVAVNQSQSVDELIARVTQIVGDAFYGEHFGVLLFDEKKRTLRTHPSYRGVQNGNYPPEIPLNQGISGRAAATRQPQRVGDVRRDRDYVAVTDGTRSELCVPIQSGSRLIGVINVENRRLDHFTEADERLLGTIAGQLGSAIEKMRLAQTEQRRLLELEALYENSMAISGLLDADAIARAFMDTLEGRLRWHHAAVRLIEPNGEMRVIGLQSPHFKPGDTVPQKFRLQALVSRVGQGMAGWAAQHGQSLRSGDLPSDPRYVATYPGIRSGLYVPLKVDDKTIGVVSVESEQPDAFTELDERLLNTLAAQTAMALQRSRLFAEAQRRLRRTQTLRQIDISITNHAPLDETIRNVLRYATDELGVDAAVVLLLDPRDQRLKYKFGMGFYTDALQHTSLKLGDGYAGRAALTRQTVIIPNLQTHTTDFLRSPAFSREKFVSYFGVPLIVESQVLGVLELFHRAPLHPNKEWLDFMETLAGQIAIAIDNATLYQNLQQANLQLTAAYDATIEGWSRALDLRDKETEGHTQRVTELTLKLARQIGIPEADLIHIRRGALLHDIGKMGIPDSILLKPGPLSEEEWRIMRRHPQYAYEMLVPIEYLHPALDIPHYHHEKWDGTGYPHGLKGEQIPLAARIFAIADVWDALTSDRPYRKAWSRKKALAHIRKQSGQHFDPQVVEAFKVLSQNGEL